MAPEDGAKTFFITSWGTFCYKIMPFVLKNVGAIYQREMTALFHDMMNKEMEVYVNNILTVKNLISNLILTNVCLT